MTAPSLAVRLLAAIDALEYANRVVEDPDGEDEHNGWLDWETLGNLDSSWHTLECGSYFGSQAGGGDRCQCGVPEAVRRRCAADRAVVEICETGLGLPDPYGDAYEVTLAVLIKLAEGYGIEVTDG